MTNNLNFMVIIALVNFKLCKLRVYLLFNFFFFLSILLFLLFSIFLFHLTCEKIWLIYNPINPTHKQKIAKYLLEPIFDPY